MSIILSRLLNIMYILKKIYFLLFLVILIVFTNSSLLSQERTIPIKLSYRKAILTRSYVLQIQNISNGSLNLWLQAKGKITTFNLASGREINFGWVQGYHFDANNLFLIGGNGYDTLRYVMPNVELSPWRITFPKSGGLALSLSQSFLQNQLTKRIKFPITVNSSRVLRVSIDQPPNIILKEGSDKIYLNAVLDVWVFYSKIRIPIVVDMTCIPFYDISLGQLGVSQIKVENIDVNALPQQYLYDTRNIINTALPTLFKKYVIMQFKKKWQVRLARLVNLRTKVEDGRLEVVVF